MPTEWERDAALLEAWRGGDNRAGERLFDRHADAVVRFFENKVREAPEDLAQATFLRMLDGRERVRAGVAFRAFVLGIARNVFREHLRELGRGRKVDPDVDSMATLAPGAATLEGEREEHRLLLEGLRRLPVLDQMLLELHYWEDFSPQELAEFVGMTRSGVSTRLQRARELLADEMAKIAASSTVLDSTVRGLDGWADDLRAQLASRNNRPPS